MRGVKKASPKKESRSAKTSTKPSVRPPECRHERERAVWTAMHGFVTARPEQFLRECGDFCITAPQATLLRVMDPGCPAPMSMLATALACHASNVTGLVDRLEEQGLVTRRASEEDRRVKHICLTPKGVEVRESLCSALFAPPPELARLDEDELAALEKLLRRIEVTAQ
ncbi:MAG: Transcriptional regulator, MarR family [Labilithrix sp.]|jgi:DNA-binding MarR family transcriptional regulator|nr:Transcriptional regulator, MarR family [Labilithrix sp.]